MVNGGKEGGFNNNKMISHFIVWEEEVVGGDEGCKQKAGNYIFIFITIFSAVPPTSSILYRYFFSVIYEMLFLFFLNEFQYIKEEAC